MVSESQIVELQANDVPGDYEWWCGSGSAGYWLACSEATPLQVYPPIEGPFGSDRWTVLARKHVAPPTPAERIKALLLTWNDTGRAEDVAIELYKDEVDKLTQEILYIVNEGKK